MQFMYGELHSSICGIVKELNFKQNNKLNFLTEILTFLQSKPLRRF